MVIIMPTKKKRLTNKEKQLNKKIRNEMRDAGILPPIKPKLNRKKFAKEVHEEWKSYGDIFYLTKALNWFAPNGTSKLNITSEQVGALKVMKLAIAIKQFEEESFAKGKSSYNAMELYEKVVKHIIDL